MQVKEVVLSKFTETMFRNAREPLKGIVTGEPDSAVRQTWSEIHHKARRIAGGLAAAGFGSGDVAALLVQDPAEIASTIQAIWMRGACFTMLHPPGVRSPRAVWAADSSGAIRTINASVIIISEPFEDCRSIVEEWGTVKVLTVAELLASVPGGCRRYGGRRRGADTANVGVNGRFEGCADNPSQYAVES